MMGGASLASEKRVPGSPAPSIIQALSSGGSIMAYPGLVHGKREKSSSWKGGRRLQNGYVMIMVGDGKYRQEHRLIMESIIGRRLTDDEVVHHANGDRADNRIENLVLMTRKDHGQLHRPRMVAACHPEKPYGSHGMCKTCYAQYLREKDREHYREANRRFKQRKRDRKLNEQGRNP
jgi:hypothetical protein